MTISYAAQKAWIADDTQRARVNASAATSALVYLLGGLPPNSDATKQAQRVDLIYDILVNQQYQTTMFGWLIITANSLNTYDDATDSFMDSTVEGSFDLVAQLAHPTP